MPKDNAFVLGLDTNTIQGYDLTTPDDIESAVLNVDNKLEVEGSGTVLTDKTTAGASPTYVDAANVGADGMYATEYLQFSSDGSRMIFNEGANIKLTTPYDPYTQDFSDFYQNFSWPDVPYNIHGAGGYRFSMRPNGQNIYTWKENTSIIYQWGFGTDFDLTTASYQSKSLDVSSQTTGFITQIEFNTAGTRMFLIDTAKVMYQYDLSVAWDISTAVYNSVSHTFSSVSTIYDFSFISNGAGIYFTNLSQIKLFPLGTDWDISTVGSETTETPTPYNSNIRTVLPTPTGDKLYICQDTYGSLPNRYTIGEFDMSTNHNIGTLSFNRSIPNVVTQQRRGSASITPDGLHHYRCHNTGEGVVHYSPKNGAHTWSQGVQFASEAFILPANESAGGVTVEDSGTKMFVAVTVSGTTYIRRYDLSTAYDSASAGTYVNQFDITYSTADTFDILFSPDGTKMYLTSYAESGVGYHTLGTPWDLSTVTYQSKIEFTYQGGSNLWFDQSTAFNDDGTIFYFHESSRIHQAPLTVPYDLTTRDNAKVTRVVAPDYLIGFNGNGSSIFVGSTNMSKYDLTAPYVIADTIFTDNFGEDDARGFFFKEDGLKLFITGAGINHVIAYDLSVAKDLTTAVKAEHYDLDGKGNDDIWFSDDGLKFFTLNASNTRVEEFDMSVAWDVSTATYTSQYSVSAQVSSAGSLMFNSDGTRMYVTSINTNKVYEYTLGTAWNITTASHTNGREFSFSSQDAAVRGLTLNPDNNTMIAVGNSNNRLYEYNYNGDPTEGYSIDITGFGLASIPTQAHDLDDAPTFETSMGAVGRSLIRDHKLDQYVSSTTTQLVYNEYGGRVPEIGDSFELFTTANPAPTGEVKTLTGVASVDYTGAPISSATFLDTHPITHAGFGNACDVFVSKDGTQMFSPSGNYVYGFTMSTPFDTTTLANAGKFATNNEITFTTRGGVYFDDDGQYMFAISTTTRTVVRYTLQTPWDITTAVYNDNVININAYDSSPTGVEFNNDGTVMYIVGFGDSVHQFNLSVAWDLLTASFDSSFSLLSQMSNPYKIGFNSDGSKMFALGGDAIHQYTLGTKFDISTATYDTNSYPITEETNIVGLHIHRYHPLVMVSAGTATDQVHAYSVNVHEYTEYTVDYGATTTAADPAQGTPLMLARTTTHTANAFVLNGQSVQFGYPTAVEAGRELAFKHVAKNIDDEISVTRFDLNKLDS